VSEVTSMPRYDIVTFDCYGTLIDWEGGIAAAFRDAGVDLDRDAVLRAYAEHEPVAERPPFRPYREVLADTATRVAKVRDGSFLAESLPSWTPFPDTNAALERLRAAGYRLGILSNVDDDLLAATRRHFSLPSAIGGKHHTSARTEACHLRPNGEASDQQGTPDDAGEYRPDRTKNREGKPTCVCEMSHTHLLQGTRRVIDERCEKEDGRHPRHHR